MVFFAFSLVITFQYMQFAKKHKERHDKQPYYGRAYSKPNEAWLIRNYNWDEVYSCNNVNLAWANSKRAFIGTLDHHASYKLFNSRVDRNSSVSNEMLEIANERDNLASLAKKTNFGGPDVWQMGSFHLDSVESFIFSGVCSRISLW